MMKIKTRLQWVLLRVMAVLLPQKAVVRMETPAAAIMATTAGRRVATVSYTHLDVYKRQEFNGVMVVHTVHNGDRCDIAGFKKGRSLAVYNRIIRADLSRDIFFHNIRDAYKRQVQEYRMKTSVNVLPWV